MSTLKDELEELALLRVKQQQMDHAIALAQQATDGALRDCNIVVCVSILISQRDNARSYAETFRKRLKELGEEYI